MEEYSQKVREAVRGVDPRARVYVIGGVAEDRVTVYSDIDLLIVFPYKVSRTEMNRRILSIAFDEYSLPWDAPVELHIVDEEGAKEYFRHAKRVIEIP